MAKAIAHFSLGAALMIILIAILVPTIRYQRSAIVLSGIWAMVPDLPRLIPQVRPVMEPIIFTPIGDVFWFHNVLDRFDDSTVEFAALMVGFLFATAVLADLRDELLTHE